MIIDTHYTTCRAITGKRYDQMNVHKKINCKSYYEIFIDKAPWSLDLLINWMQTDRIYSSNFQQQYKNK